MQLNWTVRATQARQKAIHYVARLSAISARRQFLEVIRQTNQLLPHPGLGRRGRQPGTRELVISGTPYIVVYRIDTAAHRIDILNFLHASQKWPPVP